MGWFDGFTNFFKKKRRLEAHFIDEVGNYFVKTVKYQNNTFHLTEWGAEPESYIVDMNFVIFHKKTHMPISFYYRGNPNPIRLQHERNADVDSIGFKKILDSKTISDLFSQEGNKKMNIILILVVANIVLTLLLVLIQFKVFKVS